MVLVQRLLVAASIAALTQTAAFAQIVEPSPAAAPAAVTEPAVDAFYTARNQAPIWLKDEGGRAAVALFAGALREALLDGLPDAADLAGRVDAAAAANDDKAISAAWVRYVQALRAPVRGMNYGDPALAPKRLLAAAILAQAALAPSLADHVRQTAAINPFYAALGQAAVAQGATADPHVRATLDRLRIIPSKGRALLVDVANAQLMILEDGNVVDTMKVIVGKPEAATPLLAGTIHYVTFNPYWHIPQDVAKRKVAPIVLKRGVSYLKSARYETVAAFGYKEEPIDPESVDWKAVAEGTVEAHIRQKAGPGNMMGAMKFGFVNDYGIFLHDTPHKDFFAKAKRNLSLGCVR